MDKSRSCEQQSNIFAKSVRTSPKTFLLTTAKIFSKSTLIFREKTFKYSNVCINMKMSYSLEIADWKCSLFDNCFWHFSVLFINNCCYICQFQYWRENGLIYTVTEIREKEFPKKLEFLLIISVGILIP